MVRSLEACVEVGATAPEISCVMVLVLLARATKSLTWLVHGLAVGVDVRAMAPKTSVGCLGVVSYHLGGGVVG